MNLSGKSKKEIGNIGERVAVEYLKRHGFRIVGRNVAKKTGELDIVAGKQSVLYFVEVKTRVCGEFSSYNASMEYLELDDAFDPAANLHAYKIHKVARTAEWYVAEHEWEGDWQIDGVLVWLRERDGMARVRYLPQIV